MTVTLVVGGVWWAQGEEPAGPALAAHGVTTNGGANGDGPGAGGSAANGKAANGKAADGNGGNGKGASGHPGAAPAAAGPGARGAAVAPKPQRPPAPLNRSRPTTLAVPAITVEAPVVDLGLDGSGRLATPPVDNPRVVGWYANGVSPGERGTAVVVGHRDTRTGPAIFINLNALNPGNTIRVARADGRVAVFTVDRVRTYAKSAFPSDEVYGPAKRPELRVLTCGGAFDRKEGYASNIVVFAHLTGVDRQI
ncbi:class F sortase [Streptomyces roseicoloratus]|uniref:Class F sortase n=1 Tax=Streptomyces roseicoloratus TaxID=2508722 RepID=A0ABY9S053_9ACTN|nr:class F sortase [Streptomyces roseicoloratus]WMX47800.1 class F sortase [Streptomyces roseicoloratus]